MSWLIIQESKSSLNFDAGTLVVKREGKTVRSIPPHQIEGVHLYGHVELSPAARDFLMAQGMDVLFFSYQGRYRGRLLGQENRTAERRVAQYKGLLEPKIAIELTRMIVRAKVQNQRHILQKAHRRNASATLEVLIGGLDRCLGQVDELAQIDGLRGLEGRGAALYFEGFSGALRNADFQFVHRNRRPPRDPVNALLSYGYALLQGRVESAVQRVGLDPYFGALHQPGRGKPALVLDLMESLRPFVVDRMVLRLLNRRQISREDFEEVKVHISDDAEEAPLDGAVEGHGDVVGVYIAKQKRGVFLEAFVDCWERRYWYAPRDLHIRLDDILDHHVMQVAKFLSKEDESVFFLTAR